MARPSSMEQARRRREFLRLVASGADFAKAAEDARLHPVRALAILSAPEVRQMITQAA